MKKLFLLFLLLLGGWHFQTKDKSVVTIGIITDVQYCNYDNEGTRYYRNSIAKLDDCINYFNSQQPAFIAHLGDTIDRDFTSFDAILPGFKKSTAPICYVLGNHDFSVTDSLKPLVVKKLGMPNDYYSKDVAGWKFIFLNGNELSAFYPKNKSQQAQFDSLFKHLKEKNKCNATAWNGGISKEQFDWLKNELVRSQKENKKVIIMCHFPVYPSTCLNLLNDDEVVGLMNNFKCVKAYFCGHNHKGDYTLKDGIHYITFKGMLETEDTTAFSKVTLTQDSIFVYGYGREPSRRLKIY
jgi:manganese-dependent ADP-ribose/CDP-alcohol diphosphatase